MTPAQRKDASGPARRRVAGARSRRPSSASAETVAPATTSADVTKRERPASAEVAAPATTSADGTTARQAWWRSSWLLAGLAVVTALAVAAAVALVVIDGRNAEVSDARTAAVAAAREHAETILSYDHTTLDEDFAAALAVSTGGFAEEYRETSESAVRPTATETEAVVDAETVAAGVVTAEPDRVVVLVFVNQTTTSNRLDQAQTDLNRVRLTLVETDQGWLVEAVEAL